MTPDSLQAWMTRLNLNKVQACHALGISRMRLDRYISGQVNIPKSISLACAAIAQGLPPIK